MSISDDTFERINRRKKLREEIYNDTDWDNGDKTPTILLRRQSNL